MNTKTCTKCTKAKPLEEFSKAKTGKYGRRGDCKTCRNKYAHERYAALPEDRRQGHLERSREWIAENRDRHLKKSREWYATNRERHRNAVYNWRAKNREKNLAYMADHRATIKGQAQIKLNLAVRSGRIIRPTACTQCGKANTRIEGHHEDYNQPLAVAWLCTACHALRHREK